MSTSLLSSTARLQVPFVIAKIGDFSFGAYSKTVKKQVLDSFYNTINITYPNYIQRLNITKINGSVNTYSLTLVYGIKPGDDPNLIDKILSKVKDTRKIVFTYGDLAIPNFIYREEEAIIKDINYVVNLENSNITYSISAVSTSIGLAAGNYNFEAIKAKPSDMIKKLLYNYGLTQVFYGMRNRDLVDSKNLIASNDKEVLIEAKTQISLLDYLKYLVNCMTYIGNNPNDDLTTGRYLFSIEDDLTGDLGGPYFKVKYISNNLDSVAQSDYEIDVGYGEQAIPVSNFSITDNQAFAILYDYADDVKQDNYIYKYNDKGELESMHSPSITNTAPLMKTTQSYKNWWSNMTKYPINATMTINGLLKPAMLLSNIKINVYFYGQKHTSSGVYTITKQSDDISENGYKTTLTLLKVGGDAINGN